jgi:hypothetical protein
LKFLECVNIFALLLMQRSRVIATIVLGSWGIVVTPLVVPWGVESESWVRVLWDGV